MHNTEKYNYTLTMETLFRNKMSRLYTFYCREDFEYSIKQVKRAGKDAVRFRMHDLEVMCRARGLDADALLKDKKLLAYIPTREKMQSELLEILHDIYTNVPRPADYMERIVRRLAPEYSEDTVRAVILKKFIVGVGLKWKDMKASVSAIIDVALGKMTDQERARYDVLPEKEKLEMAAEKLDDSIFTPERLKIELSSLELVRLIVKRLDLLAAKYDIVNEKGNPCEFAGLTVRAETYDAMRSFCESYGLQCDEFSSVEQILQTILKAYEEGVLCEENATEQMAPFFGLLEKDFSVQMAKTLYKNQKGKKDKATGLFKTDKRDARAKKGVDWALLTLCEDFAQGRFQNNNGKTRVYLYYFAMVFGMTVVLKEDDEYYPETDMVRNLFEDYYSDNLVRFLDGQYADPQALSAVEREPSGDGINYKNFAEAIYLYYLYRTDFEMTPGERIERAEWMISECIKRAKSDKEKDDILTESIEEHTVVY
ncbi:MAG: hypothetical protein IJP38_03060, partial [Oscillospiraceae bacterium]|nr:hypothetical protein [Oscillospiraceae bacterium]